MHTKDRSVPRALAKPDSLSGFTQLLKKRSEKTSHFPSWSQDEQWMGQDGESACKPAQEDHLGTLPAHRPFLSQGPEAICAAISEPTATTRVVSGARSGA